MKYTDISFSEFYCALAIEKSSVLSFKSHVIQKTLLHFKYTISRNETNIFCFKANLFHSERNMYFLAQTNFNISAVFLFLFAIRSDKK